LSRHFLPTLIILLQLGILHLMTIIPAIIHRVIVQEVQPQAIQAHQCKLVHLPPVNGKELQAILQTPTNMVSVSVFSTLLYF